MRRMAKRRYEKESDQCGADDPGDERVVWSAVSAANYGTGAGLVSEAGQWRTVGPQRRDHRIAIDRAIIHLARLFSLAPVQRRNWLRRRQFQRIESWSYQSIA